MISVHLQGKPFNITVIQVYAPTSNAEEAECEWFYEDLQDLLELTPPPQKKVASGVSISLCDPMACSPPGSSVHGISQVRILEWDAISFSRDLPNLRIEPMSPAWQVDSSPLSHLGSP